MNEKTINAKYLKDYLPPNFFINSVNLHFDLTETHTLVTASISFTRNPINSQADLCLQGDELELISIELNEKPLNENQYQLPAGQLVIKNVPDHFTLLTKVKIKPQENTQLSGLYKTQSAFCTQCEAEGFRRITFFLDRPDVLAQYQTTIVADKTKYPVLLSNGNLIETGDIESNKHYVVWEDPFKKPCYLFALVAGNLGLLEDEFITMNARRVKLRIYVELGNEEKAKYAMYALKQAMAWDEKVFGREYDLDIYMIVAVSDFNMGAMENKGLNIFNDKYILANPQIATDTDYENILQVVGHEYFHNWSGNRITCRDWFQLSLKEGLTIFREHEFGADMTSHAVKRISEARLLRTYQYPEDAGPMAHPVQPDCYLKIDNFYTHTIYEKGSEVIRMLRTIIGKENFMRGMELYFTRHDGQAVTIEEFVKAMEDASRIDLIQFRRWYKQIGTPILNITSEYDAATQQYKLYITQSLPHQSSQKEALHIPLAVGLIAAETGESIIDTKILELKKTEENFTFKKVTKRPIVSLLRDFSAPVIINYDYTDAELAQLMTHDKDAFSQWEAGQNYVIKIFRSLIAGIHNKKSWIIPEIFTNAFKEILLSTKLNKSFQAELLLLPTEKYLMELLLPIDVAAAHQAYKFLHKTIAFSLKHDFRKIYKENYSHGSYSTDKEAIAQRKLANTSLSHFAKTEDKTAFDLAIKQYRQSNNMTNTMAALSMIVNSNSDNRADLLQDFYQRYQQEHLVIDKWFSLQATADHENVFEQVKSLSHHPDFNIKNPNRLRSLVTSFCVHNPYYFHREDGAGYEFLADFVCKLNKLNPQIAARLVEPLTHWKKFCEPQKKLMKAQLEKISKEQLSADVFEVVEKSLLNR